VDADGTIRVEPGLDTPAGQQTYTLVVKMDDYNDLNGDTISSSVSFNVNIV